MPSDSISLEISASAKQAESALTGLTQKLGTLNTQLAKIDTKGLQKFASGLSMVSNSMIAMKDVKIPDFNRAVKGIKTFESINGKKISEVSSALTPLATSISMMNGVRFDNTSLTSFVRAISSLSNSNLNSLNVDSFNKLGDGLNKLSGSLASTKEVSKNTLSMVNSMAQLARAGQYIPTVTSELPNLSIALRNFMDTMSRAPAVNQSVISFTSNIGYLASAGVKTRTTASNLAYLGQELKKFFTTMSTAPHIRQDIISMTDALGRLASQGSKVSSAGNLVTNSFRKMRANASSTTNSIKSLAYAFGKFYANCWLFIRAFRTIGKSIDLSSQLTEVQNVVSHTFKDMTGEVNEFSKTSVETLGMSELTFKQISSRFQAMGSAMNIPSSSIESANEYLNKVTAINEEGERYIKQSNRLGDVSINLTRLTADMASFYDVDQKDVAEDLESILTGMTRPLRTYGLDLTQATLKEWAMKNGLDSNIESMSQAQKTMLRYQYVLANTTNAQNDFARTQNTWANQVRILKQQFQRLGYVIGNDFVQALKPALHAINTMMSALNKFAVTVSNALGKIFGWQYEVGGGIPSSTEDDLTGISDALDDATGKAKALKRQLQGFDELNVLNTDDDSGSGGSGSGASSGGYSGADDNGKWVETPRLYESAIKDLYGLGDYIGTTLTQELASINWNSVYEKAKGFGKGLADFLNGLISPELFGELGTTIASSLNTVIYASLSFTDNFDFREFGESIANGINNFFETFDFESFADAVNGWLNGIKDFIIGLISTIDWGDIAKGIGDFLASLDFGTVSLFIGAILLKKAGSFVVTLASGFIDALKEAMVKKIVSSLAGSGAVATGGSAIVSIAIPVLATVVITFASVEIGKLLGFSLIDDFMKTLGADEESIKKTKKEVEKLLNFKDVTEITFGGKGKKAVNQISPLVREYADKKGIPKSLTNTFLKAWNAGMSIDERIGKILGFKNEDLEDAGSSGGKTFIKSFDEGFNDGAKNLITSMSKTSKSIGKNATTSMSNGITGNASIVSRAMNGIASGLKNVFSGSNKTFSNIGSSMSTAIGNGVTKTSGTASSSMGLVAKAIKGVFNTSSTDYTTIGSGISKALGVGIQSTSSMSKTAMDGVSSAMKNTWNTSSTDYTTIGSSISDSLGSGIKGAKNKATSAMSNVSSTLSGTWNNAPTTYRNIGNSAMSGLDSGIRTRFNSTKVWFANNSRLNMPTVPIPNILAGVQSAWYNMKRWWNNLSLSFPQIKLPHFTVSGGVAPYGIGGKGSLPSVSVSFYKNGGFPDADLFFANENGVPELVGTMNGKTAVASGHEITGISDAVYSTGQTEAKLLERAVTLLDAISQKEFGISADEVFSSVRRSDRDYARRTGNSAFVY